MAQETERRFLVREDFAPASVASRTMQVRQSYLQDSGSWVVRVRAVAEQGVSRHFLALKRPVSPMTNLEHDMPISADSYADVRKSCGAEVVKTRHVVLHGGRSWEIDVYAEGVEPGMIAEVELPGEDEQVELPDWIGREVTGDRWYSNAQIAERIGLQGEGR